MTIKTALTTLANASFLIIAVGMLVWLAVEKPALVLGLLIPLAAGLAFCILFDWAT